MHHVNLRAFRSWALVWAPPLLVGAIVFGCGGNASHSTSSATRGSSTTRSTVAADVKITAQSFRNLQAMTPIRDFFVDNLMGDLPATIAVANSKNGGTYPPGTVIQLFPQEAMVKHRAGWNPATNDWEFFALDISATGTKITTRGVENVVNRFGVN
jgi:hypothetical protein